MRDGGVTQPLDKLASIGKDGHFKGNAYRDMMRFIASRLPFFDSVKPYHFSAPCPSIKKAGLSKVSVYATLPHEVFAAVFLLSQRLFHGIFNTKCITDFWERESATRAIPQGDLTRVVPIRLWGDDASHCKTSSFEALTWTSATLHRADPFRTKMPFGAYLVMWLRMNVFTASLRGAWRLWSTRTATNWVKHGLTSETTTVLQWQGVLWPAAGQARLGKQPEIRNGMPSVFNCHGIITSWICAIAVPLRTKTTKIHIATLHLMLLFDKITFDGRMMKMLPALNLLTCRVSHCCPASSCKRGCFWIGCIWFL